MIATGRTRSTVLVAVGWGSVLALGSLGAGVLTDDRIEVSKAESRDAAMVVVHGQNSTDVCPTDVLAGGGTHVIANVEPPSACRVVVFARYHPVQEVAPAWTAGPDQVDIALAGGLEAVRLKLFIVTNDARADGWALADVRRAQRVFRRSRAGFTFSAEVAARHGTLSNADLAIIGESCARADAIRSSFSQYDASRINVFYVDLINNDTSWSGYNCYEKRDSATAGAPNIIFVSLGARFDLTLAHELGHAMGLQLATGHTGPPEDVDITGFRSTNIMWTGLDSDKPDLRKTFSLGQAFRMNADDHSWLHALKSGPGLPVRGCHPSGPLNRTPCPPLALDVP